MVMPQLFVIVSPSPNMPIGGRVPLSYTDRRPWLLFITVYTGRRPRLPSRNTCLKIRWRAWSDLCGTPQLRRRTSDTTICEQQSVYRTIATRFSQAISVSYAFIYAVSLFDIHLFSFDSGLVVTVFCLFSFFSRFLSISSLDKHDVVQTVLSYFWRGIGVKSILVLDEKVNFLDPKTGRPQALPTLLLWFFLLSDFHSTKAFSFHCRSSLNLAYGLKTIFSTIAPCPMS